MTLSWNSWATSWIIRSSQSKYQQKGGQCCNLVASFRSRSFKSASFDTLQELDGGINPDQGPGTTQVPRVEGDAFFSAG